MDIMTGEGFIPLDSINAINWHYIIGRGDIAVVKNDRTFRTGQLVFIDNTLCLIRSIEITSTPNSPVGLVVRKINE